MKHKTVSVGPVRIPETYNDALATLLKDHVTKSDLFREAIYQFLKGKNLIEDRKVLSGIDGSGSGELLFYIEDHTQGEEKEHLGYWVMMREPDGGEMIIFTGLRKEIAKHFRNRFEKAISWAAQRECNG